MQNKTLQNILIERKKRTEQSLKQSGAEQCQMCNYWMSSEFIIDGLCNECIDIKEKSNDGV